MLAKGQEVFVLHLRQGIADIALEFVRHCLDVQAGVAAERRRLEGGVAAAFSP